MSTFYGNATPETIAGSTSADTLYGGGDNDTITGLGGNDVIHGDTPSPSGNPLTGEILVNQTTVGAQGTPNITGLSDGRAVAIWHSAPTTGFQETGQYSAQFLDANGVLVGPEIHISALTGSTHAFDHLHYNRPEAMELANGNILFTYTAINPGSNWEVMGRIYAPDGSPVAAEFVMTDEPDGAWQVNGMVAPDANGGFRLTYQSAYQGGDGGYGVWMRSFDANGVALNASAQVNTYQTWDQGAGEIAQLSTGGHVAVWISLHQGESNADPAGHVVANVYMQRYDASGNPAGVETLVHPQFTTDTQSRPDVIALPNGEFLVTWHSWDEDGSGFAAMARRFDANGIGQPVFQVNLTTAADQYQTRVAALPNGGYVVVWQSEGQDGDAAGIYYRVFDANDVGGQEQRANITTAGRQMIPAVTALASGGFAISWSSADGQDGDSAGIYTRYFDATGLNSVPGDDKLFGGAGNDAIEGNDGDDTLNGGTGNDMLDGNSGDDRLVGGAGDDNMDGGAGDDSVAGGGGADRVGGGAGNDLLKGNGGADTMGGSAGDDTVNGGGGDDVLFGAVGADKLIGGGGADELLGGDDDDNLNGGAGDDWLQGDDGNDGLLGGGGSDSLFGGNGDDSLSGNAAADWLQGGAGQDSMSGGAGADTFAFLDVTDSAVGTTRDQIIGFQTGTDQIDLTLIDADTNIGSDQAFQNVSSGAFTNIAGQLRYNSGVLAGDVDGDGVADFEIAVVGLGFTDILL